MTLDRHALPWIASVLCLLTGTTADAGDMTPPESPTSLRTIFASPPQRYWPRPLWFWNDTRVTADTVREHMRQARDRCRYGGFGILPFGKQFSPPYLSDAYFAVYGAALEQAKALGLTMSLYDEYGFPSGSAGSQNSSDTSLFAQRWPELTIKRLDKHEWPVAGPARFETNLPPGSLAALVAMNTETLERIDLTSRAQAGRFDWAAPAGSWKIMAFVCVRDGDPICDYLDPEAADRFIEITHQAYYDRFAAHFGTTIDSTFFDEPTLYRAAGRTWTDRFNEKFEARHGFDPRPYYPALWLDIGPETQAARNSLFGFRAELYAEGFTRRIQEWCARHGIQATGHQDQEEVVNPVSISGDLMKCFKHLDIPGIDKIGGDRPAERFYKLVSSAAYNWDKSMVMSETYGAMGDLSWDAIYTVAMEQYTKGINMLIPHAVWYDDTRVTFKPELSWRHPAYAGRLPEFNTYLARLNTLLQNDAAHVADIAVLYPIATLQGSHHLDGPLGHYQGGVGVPEADYVDVGELLSVTLGRDYTFLHPEVLDRKCVIERGHLVLPNRVHPGRFSVLILPGHKTIQWTSLAKIKAFYDQGGCVLATGQLPSKSAEFGRDADVVRAVTEMFDTSEPGADASAAFALSRNAEGGCAIRLRALSADALRQALEAARPVCDVAFQPGQALRYIHKCRDSQHIYFFANLDPKLSECALTLRGRHDLEAWNPHTGEIAPVDSTHANRDGIALTRVRLALPYLKSVFLVSATGTVDAIEADTRQGAGDSALAWPDATRESRPWAYNWWLGSGVDTNNLARELRRYRDAGLGGIHVIPIYGARGAESRYLEYLSPAWLDAFKFYVEEAGRLDLGVDMTTGTGWCFGGPNVPATDGGWQLRTSMVTLAPGDPLTNRIDPASVVALVAEIGDARQAVNLAGSIRPDGTVDWRNGAETARVCLVTAVPAGPMVKRAAPGGAGPMLNPFSHRAMTNYLARFTEAFDRFEGPLPRAMYHDSYEYNSSWVPGVQTEFAQRRGYLLENHWPDFCRDPATDERAARVRCDYQETLSDLMIESVYPEWIRWCRSRGIRTRNQAHGSPANLLDLYALADVPETEMFGRGTRDPLRSRFDERFLEGDRNPLICKFASSAAHIAGRPLVAAETGTWMAEHFCETLEELKCLVDLLFAAGVNHVIYHGTCYSPDDAPWPGWLFYASTQMNPRSAIWRDAPVLNAYIERCQSMLRGGRPDNDILLYWPLHDFWQSSPGPVTRMTVHDHTWLTGQPVGVAARQLWERGYAFDYVSDRLLASARVDDAGRVKLPGADYAVVLVPRARLMPVTTLRNLATLASRGATVLFEDRIPDDVPGLATLDQRRAELKDIVAALRFESSTPRVRQAAVGRGRILVGELETLLAAAGVPHEPLGDHAGLRVLRRRHDEGRLYFIANQSTSPLFGWHALATPARSVVVMDAMTGHTGLAETRPFDAGRTQVRLELEPGHSVLLRTFDRRDVQGPAWSWLTPGSDPLALPGPWQVEFVEGGPALPKRYETAALQSWTRNGDPEAERFAGTAVFRTTFEAPPGEGPWLLDLGVVCHSARVRLNGAEIGRVIMPPYRLALPSLRPDRNRLEVEVTNLSANRVRDLDRRKVAWRVFHDINLVNVNYRPFDASEWPVLDSGLLGPVALRAFPAR